MSLLKKYTLPVVLIAAMLASCNISKPYRRTDLNIPQQYRETIAVTADTVLLSWKTFFKDPTLVALIEKALQGNNEVAVALRNMQQLNLHYKQAKLSMLPALDLNMGANRNWLSRNSLNGSLSSQFLGSNYLDDYSASLSVAWEADIWGKTRMMKEAALADYFAQKENLSALKTRIIVQVAQAYYNLITLDEQLKIAHQNIDLSDSTLQIIRLQYASGLVNSLAVEQAEAQKKTAELIIPLALQNIAISENALSILCGNYPDHIHRATSLSNTMPQEVFPTGVPAMLLSRRPDVKAAEQAIVSANSRTGLARAAMYPSISLSSSAGANSFKFNTWFDLPGSIVKNVGANLVQPIFRKKALKTAYEVAIIEQEKLAVQFRQSVLTAVGEVSDALATSTQTDQRVALLEQKKTSLAKANKDALLLYKSGVANYLEVITAQNNALQNDLETINTKREKLNALVALYMALGGGADI